MKFLRLVILLLLPLSACQQRALYLYQMKIDPTYLASTNVGSPDFRKAPRGQMVIAEWMIPKPVLDMHPTLRIQMLFCDFSQKCVEFPIRSRVGYEIYMLINDEMCEKEGFLAYMAEIITPNGHIEAEWKHQLWVKLIDVDEMSSAVELKSRQGSVIDTPG